MRPTMSPRFYSFLSDDEWAVMEAWFAETDELQVFGESNVPLLSFVQGLVMGNGIRRIVQLGHYYGYSTLLIGFMLRRMNAKPGIVSIDISDEVTRFTKKWIGRAGLDQYARLIVGDSASEGSYQAATAYLGGQPELIIIDSSHQYAHTIDELNLWTAGLPKGAIVLLHDTSGQATEYDPTRRGRRATGARRMGAGAPGIRPHQPERICGDWDRRQSVGVQGWVWAWHFAAAKSMSISPPCCGQFT